MNVITTDLADTVASIISERDLGYALADFVDRFKFVPDLALVEREPALLRDALNDDGLADAYLAATAAWLCHQHGLKVPIWAEGNSRALAQPYIAAKTANLRALLIQESPPEFRVRNVFVSANALSRA
ncbi:MAG: hypothetical protein WCN98_14880 [Verrucomicrobiaceae bacterium]